MVLQPTTTAVHKRGVSMDMLHRMNPAKPLDLPLSPTKRRPAATSRVAEPDGDPAGDVTSVDLNDLASGLGLENPSSPQGGAGRASHNDTHGLHGRDSGDSDDSTDPADKELMEVVTRQATPRVAGLLESQSRGLLPELLGVDQIKTGVLRLSAAGVGDERAEVIAAALASAQKSMVHVLLRDNRLTACGVSSILRAVSPVRSELAQLCKLCCPFLGIILTWTVCCATR